MTIVGFDTKSSNETFRPQPRFFGEEYRHSKGRVNGSPAACRHLSSINIILDVSFEMRLTAKTVTKDE